MVAPAVEGIDVCKIAGESISGMSSLRNESELSPYLFLIRFITSRSKDSFPAIACSFALPPAFSDTLVHEEQKLKSLRNWIAGLLAHCDYRLSQVY